MSAKPQILPLLLAVVLLASGGPAEAKKSKKKQQNDETESYAEYVWPPPPDKPRIQLEAILSGRVDVETKGSRLKKILAGAAPPGTYDQLSKPIGVAFDPEGRILVTDWGSRALFRFDRDGRRLDVFGTQSTIRLKEPMGLGVGKDGTIYVADAGEAKVLAFDPSGDLVSWYGEGSELTNPTDAAVSPDGAKLWVTDSKAHRIAVFDVASRALEATYGRSGSGDGEFAFPSALAIGPEGNVFVVDQINARVQMLDGAGEYLDQFGGRGTGFGNFVRPKGIAVDEVGFIYVIDFSFNNFQLFDADFTLLTFVGEGGSGPGRFEGASDVAVRGDRIAVVEQLGRRVQVFRFLVSKTGE